MRPWARLERGTSDEGLVPGGLMSEGGMEAGHGLHGDEGEDGSSLKRGRGWKDGKTICHTELSDQTLPAPIPATMV